MRKEEGEVFNGTARALCKCNICILVLVTNWEERRQKPKLVG